MNEKRSPRPYSLRVPENLMELAEPQAARAPLRVSGCWLSGAASQQSCQSRKGTLFREDRDSKELLKLVRFEDYDVAFGAAAVEVVGHVPAQLGDCSVYVLGAEDDLVSPPAPRRRVMK